MTQLDSSYANETYEVVVSEYLNTIHETMEEIKTAIHLLEHPSEHLEQKILLVHNIMVKTIEQLEDLEEETKAIISGSGYAEQRAA